jgi:hypothetical protein
VHYSSSETETNLSLYLHLTPLLDGRSACNHTNGGTGGVSLTISDMD